VILFILDLRRIIFGDSFFEKYLNIETENEDLKLKVQVLELQLSTLKKKLNLQKEVLDLVKVQEIVSVRLGKILALLKEF
jgi:hypothetical protein